jgi:hypothetical protein
MVYLGRRYTEKTLRNAISAIKDEYWRSLET